MLVISLKNQIIPQAFSVLLRAMLIGPTYSTNTLRLNPVPIPRFSLIGSSVAIDSIVDFLLPDTVPSLLLKENNLSSCSSQSPLLVPLCYSVLYFLSLDSLVQYHGLSIPHMPTTFTFTSSAWMGLFNSNFIDTNAYLISPLKG